MKFEVGDKVIRTTRTHRDSGMKVGDIGIVTKIKGPKSIIIDYLDSYTFDPEYFEKIEDNDTINFLP